MSTFFMDLHVHVGRDGAGNAVKITASPQLTLPNILEECLVRKGLDLVGIVDCSSYGVLHDLKKLIASGALVEMDRGGWRYHQKLTLFAGAELETVEKSGGRAHHLCFFPNMVKLEEFSGFIWQKVKNNRLSSQVCYLTTQQLFQEVKKRDGLLIPAHVFTPYKGVYGNCALRLADVLGNEAKEIKTIELGLSADRNMAMLIPELRDRLFLANSDAHSLDNIGREYNEVMMESFSFEDLKNLLTGRKGKIVASFGLDPKLGKYHRSYCPQCKMSFTQTPPVNYCLRCGEKEHFVMGVLDRIVNIAVWQEKNQVTTGEITRNDSKYYYQIPLNFLPGIGKKTKEKLLKQMGTEMNILQRSSQEELAEVVGPALAELIIKGRKGELPINPGGGGKYGRIMDN